jgi:hypothetical protein
MEYKAQQVDQLLGALSPLEIDWQDETSRKAILQLDSLPMKSSYSVDDVRHLLTEDFRTGSLVIRLFLGLSKDRYEAELRKLLGPGGVGVKRFKTDSDAYLATLRRLGILEAMNSEVNRVTRWNDVLIERLRSGRGSAVSGQRRGRHVEDFAESIIREVFGSNYDARCNFTGQRGHTAKCDFAIPDKESPRIVVESKGYGATGSKMTDVIGDIQKIIAARRADMFVIFFTDGLSWLQRRSDFARIVDYQNQGDIFRIYTVKMANQFRSDLEVLKVEQGL